MKVLVCSALFSVVASAAMAGDPVPLTDQQMDAVVAGAELGTDPGQPAINFPDSFFSGNGPLQVTGVEMVMPGDNVSSVVGDAVDAFLKAKKAF